MSLIELNIATLTAPTLAPTDLFSLIPALEATPVASTNSSAPIAQDFSALLTEMIGPGAVQLPALPQVPTVSEPAQVVDEPKGKEPQEAQEAQKGQKEADVVPTQTTPIPFVPLVPFVVPSSVPATIEDKPSEQLSVKIDEPAPISVPTPAEIAAVPQPEIERAFADVKTFEFELTVQHDTAKPAGLPAQQAPALSVDAAKQAIVTTDPIANIQQQQLPPRIIAIQKVAIDSKLPERGKPEPATSSNDSATTTSTAHFTDLVRPVEQADQAPAAHQVEMPNIPHVQVLRAVAMEVGDADSQVTIRIQERGGDVTLQINAGSEPLRQDLQSSVSSLVQALKQEQIQVSNVEISRKSPIDKVRRMKEAR